MESQVTLECEGLLPSSSLLTRDGDSDIAPSSPSPVGSQQPVKKQTRQWAAWTRQEEESFFSALRQVGKNFEKITSRVQSKNKDQVRHYYYRLVRRMNKLLGPGFSLDAKDHKDTNGAMLRWWSLLEKYSCKASKLHLKPRRFKLFKDALEHQLLKDRKKKTRKRPSLSENCSYSSPANVSLQSKASGHDTRSVKLVLVDNQNIPKVASGKGHSVKRNASTGTNRSNKADMNIMKITRPRRKTGGSSSAAYKRWEKAAIAGVSLVADAAEHLERTNVNKELSPDQGMSDELLPSTLSSPTGEVGMHSFGNGLPQLPQQTSSQLQVTDTNVLMMKLKLQFFPIDETTRRALEKDEHNPHLELTLSARKKITSVMEHLNRKWGNSSITAGELMLFPYSAQRVNLVGYPRWTRGTTASAADVYAAIGSPSVFRLRYGWFSNAELVSANSGAPSTSLHLADDVSLNIWSRKDQNADAASMRGRLTGHDCAQLMDSPKGQLTSVAENTDLIPCTDFPDDMVGYIGANPENNPLRSSEHVAISSCFKKGTKDDSIRRQWEDVDNLRTAGDWADSLTNVSIGELLTESSQAMEIDGIIESSNYLHQIADSCDTFDAAIASLAARHGKRDERSLQMSHASSIWDDEETCDAFSFRKISAEASNPASLETCKGNASSSVGFGGLVKELSNAQTTSIAPICGGVAETQTRDDPTSEGVKTENPESDTIGPNGSIEDLEGFTDMYWPDSLGALDLDMPSSRYLVQEELVIGDSISLSGLNRMIANSLDAFQNCSFFGLDKKEAASTSEARETAQIFDRKIGGEV